MGVGKWTAGGRGVDCWGMWSLNLVHGILEVLEEWDGDVADQVMSPVLVPVTDLGFAGFGGWGWEMRFWGPGNLRVEGWGDWRVGGPEEPKDVGKSWGGNVVEFAGSPDLELEGALQLIDGNVERLVPRREPVAALDARDPLLRLRRGLVG